MVVKITEWQAAQYDTALADHQAPVDKGDWFNAHAFTAKVPGAIQYDLLARGKIANPYASTKAAFDCAWVAKSDWLYKAQFDTPPSALSAKTVILRLNGIDTFSEVWLNGVFLGDTENAMRVWDFPLQSGLLFSGKNTLLVRVKAHDRMVADMVPEAQKRLRNGSEIEGTLGKSLIRRYQRSFFAGGFSLLNLGTGVLGIGINRDVELLIYPGAYLSDVFWRTEKIEASGDAATSAAGKVFYTAEKAGSDTTISVTIVDAAGTVVAKAEKPLGAGENSIDFNIDKPKLWWPVGYADFGYGAAYLYTLKVVVSEKGKATQEIEQKIGIRTVELVKKDPSGKHTFFFKVNGRKILIHGENHVPLDYIKCYATEAEYDRIFKIMKNQNVNLVRIWGGSVVELDSYYKRCDEMGILVWHDMFLHSNTYPDYDEKFTANFMAEVEGIIRMMRPHTCFALICGGNEQQEGWDEWGWQGTLERFFGEKYITELIPPVAARLCPDLPYIPNSPHGGVDCQSPVIGECHNWGNFYNSTKDPLFVTETCWTHESYSRPETLKKYMDLDVDAPEWKTLDWPARWRERTHLGLHDRMPFSNFFTYGSLRDYLHNLELEQLRADYSALSEYRYRSPSNSGVVYWSNNKGGPLFQFGCVDYGGYPIMPYYAVKRIFDPIGVHAHRDVKDIVVMLSNHSAETQSLSVEAWHLDKSGKQLGFWTWDSVIESGGLVRIAQLENLYEKIHNRLEEIVYVCAVQKGKLVADDMFFPCPFREFEGEYQPLKVLTEKLKADTWRITLEASSPIRLLELESNQKLLYTDDYFPLINGKTKTVEAHLLEKTNDGPVQLRVGILGSQDVQIITL
ncbi:MAG: beta galactosidase jelly roll domain-containing protein [Treponema sp.]|jgi:beta-mannosidase|nr:beta galactosidase jelly roll domain-containing protein [Treponema sp.]